MVIQKELVKPQDTTKLLYKNLYYDRFVNSTVIRRLMDEWKLGCIWSLGIMTTRVM